MKSIYCPSLSAHQNWFGMDENLGPVAISIKKERVELRRGGSGGDASAPASQLAWQYRLIVRTSELLTLRGSVLEDAVPAVKPSNNSATYNTKDVLEYVAPELQLNCLRSVINYCILCKFGYLHDFYVTFLYHYCGVVLLSDWALQTVGLRNNFYV